MAHAARGRQDDDNGPEDPNHLQESRPHGRIMGRNRVSFAPTPPALTSATSVLIHARSPAEAAARSTFHPATLCRITRDTLPRPRTRNRFRPSHTILQAAVGRLDPRLRVAYRCANTGVPCSRRRPARRWSLSHELQLLRGRPASCGSGRPRGTGILHRPPPPSPVAPCRCIRPTTRGVPARAGLHLPGPFIHGEIVQRHRRGIDLGLAAGDRSHQLHAAGRGGLHILVATIGRVGRHLLGEQSRPLS